MPPHFNLQLQNICIISVEYVKQLCNYHIETKSESFPELKHFAVQAVWDLQTSDRRRTASYSGHKNTHSSDSAEARLMFLFSDLLALKYKSCDKKIHKCKQSDDSAEARRWQLLQMEHEASFA